MIRFVRRIGLLAFVAFLALPACGGEVDPARTPAGAAQVELMEDLYNGRFDRAYADLHPSHQTIVSRSLFARCARESISVGSLDSIEILDVFDDETTASCSTASRRRAFESGSRSRTVSRPNRS